MLFVVIADFMQCDMFELENVLPDEILGTSTNCNWGDQLNSNKPPAQGPGPGSVQINGDNSNLMGANNMLRQTGGMPQQLAHNIQIMQQKKPGMMTIGPDGKAAAPNQPQHGTMGMQNSMGMQMPNNNVVVQSMAQVNRKYSPCCFLP